MNKKLSIIVPVYNEVNTVLIVLEKLKNLKLYDDYKPQIITVDDNLRLIIERLAVPRKKKSRGVSWR